MKKLILIGFVILGIWIISSEMYINPIIAQMDMLGLVYLGLRFKDRIAEIIKNER